MNPTFHFPTGASTVPAGAPSNGLTAGITAPCGCRRGYTVATYITTIIAIQNARIKPKNASNFCRDFIGTMVVDTAALGARGAGEVGSLSTSN